MVGGNNLYMEGVVRISLKMHDLFCDELKKFKPYSDMSKEDFEARTDPMYDVIWKALEDYSNGYYANEN